MAKKGYQGKRRAKYNTGPDLSKKALTSPVMAAVASALILLGAWLMLLQKQLVSPGRILDAAESSRLYDQMPTMMIYMMFEQGPANPIKLLKLNEQEVAALGAEVFTDDWLREEMGYVVGDVAAAMSGDGEASVAMDVTGPKENLADALAGVLQSHAHNVPACKGSSSGRLCKPKGVSAAGFAMHAMTKMQVLVDRVPDQFPILGRGSASTFGTLKGVMGGLGTGGIICIVLALGLGGGAFATKTPTSPDPLLFAAGGTAAGGVLLFLVSSGIKSSITGAIDGLLRTLGGDTKQAVGAFFGEVISGAFLPGTLMLVAAALAGGGFVFYTMHKNN